MVELGWAWRSQADSVRAAGRSVVERSRATRPGRRGVVAVRSKHVVFSRSLVLLG
jgi:hypothetical protein